MSAFNTFRFPEHLVSSLEKINFKNPTSIQERVIPTIMKGSSLIGQSQTGTGKTHAFLLPIIAKINVEKNGVQAVIAAPTRELAQQIFNAAVTLNNEFPEELKMDVRSYIGGTDKQRSMERMTNQPQLVIGTPGRIYDMVTNGGLDVYTGTTLVVDEADLMIDLGFMEDVDKIASRMAKELQMLVFSATIPEKLQPFLKKYMENPKHVVVDPNQTSPAKIEHILVNSKHRDKAKIIVELFKINNPYLALIFANSKKNADELHGQLMDLGLKVGLIHGDLPARERKRVMKEIHELKYQYIVASDLAARGIDIEGVSHVINTEIPKDLDFYVHRSGRTGRAALSGVAITLYDTSDEYAITQLEKRGIEFSYKEIVRGEFVDAKRRNRREARKDEKIIVETKKHVKVSKKVKPGYKRKARWEAEKQRKFEKRVEMRQRGRETRKATKAQHSNKK